MRWMVSGVFQPSEARSQRSSMPAMAAIVTPPDEGGGMEWAV